MICFVLFVVVVHTVNVADVVDDDDAAFGLTDCCFIFGLALGSDAARFCVIKVIRYNEAWIITRIFELLRIFFKNGLFANPNDSLFDDAVFISLGFDFLFSLILDDNAATLNINNY